MSEAREALEKRAQRAMIQHALMRWESALALSGAVLTPFLLSIFDTNIAGLPNATWFGLGMGVYAALAWSSYSDPKTGHDVIEALLRDDFDPAEIKSPLLQSKIEEALNYRSRITELIKERNDTAMGVQLQSMASQFDDWIEEIYDLAKRVDDYEDERTKLQKSYFDAEKRINQLEARRWRIKDEKVKGDIDKNIASMKRQREIIESLENTMERARLRLENTITAMATIYSQTLLLSAKDIDSSRY
ncbi:MAG: hypothetical protein ACPG8W_21705, partial [Candidatus Promineifilaceae bacterium]